MYKIEFQIVIKLIRIINTISAMNVQIDINLCLIDKQLSGWAWQQENQSF